MSRVPLPFPRVERVTLALLLAGLALSLLWVVHPWYDAANDGSMYLLTARSLLRGEGYSMLEIPFVIRPPGFTLMLAPILWARGLDFHAFNLLVNAFGLVACFFLYLFARERIGRANATLVVLLLWLEPGFRRLCNQTMSDVPGLALILGCLVLERLLDRRPGWRRDIVLGLAIGLSAYVRTNLVLLVPAILCARILRKRDREERVDTLPERLRGTAIVGLTVFLCLVPWQVRNAGIELDTPVDQTKLASYGSGMWHVDPGDPESRRLSLGEVLARVPEQSAEIIETLGRRMSSAEGFELPVTFLLLGSLLWVLWKRRETAEFFAFGYLCVLLVYFGFIPRLVLPILALGLIATVELLRDLSARAAGPARRVGAERAVTMVLALVLLVEADARPDWDQLREKHETLEETVRAFESLVDEDAVLASHRAWHYALLMDRPIRAMEFAVEREGDPAAVESILDKYGVDTVLLSHRQRADRKILPYFEERYEPLGTRAARVFRVR